MALAGELIWNLDVNSSKFEAGLSKAANSAKKAGQVTEQTFGKSVTNAFKSAEKGSYIFLGALTAVGAGLATFATQGLQAAANYESLRTSLITVTGDVGKADTAFAKIKKTAADSPFFDVTTLAQFVQLMAASGQEIEVAVNSALGFGDVAAAFGKGNAEMTRMGNTLSQVIGKGKADIVDFKELVNAGWVSVRTDTAKSMGVTMEQFGEMVSAGKVGYDEIAKASAKYHGAAEAQSNNLNAVWQRFNETVRNSLATIVIESGIFDAVKNGLNGIIATLDQFTPERIGQFLGILKENLPVITGMIVGGLIPAFAGLIGILATFISTAILPLIPFIVVGGLIGLGIQKLIESMGGWEAAWGKLTGVITDIQGKLQPLVDLFQTVSDRIGQIIAEIAGKMGISFEFGGLTNALNTMLPEVEFKAARIAQIIEENWTKIKNWLAFGGTEGDASVVQALEGIWNRLEPLRVALQPIFDELMASFALVGQIFETQLKPALDALFVSLGDLWKAIQPLVVMFLESFIPVLQAVGIALGAVLAVVLGVVTGIVSGIANSLPYIVQAVEGIVQAIRGFVQILTGIFTLDFGLVVEGFKQMMAGMWDFITNGFQAILSFLKGFVDGFIAFFKGLYNTLVGNSIVPDMVNAIIAWIAQLPGRAFTALATLVKNIVTPFINAWDAVVAQVSTWGGQLLNWGKSIAQSFVNGIKAGLSSIGDAFKSAFNKAKSIFEGKSPPKDGPLKHIDDWGFNIGMAWVDGMQDAISSLSLPTIPGGDVGMPAYAGATSGAVNGGGNQSIINLNATINNDMEAYALAKIIGFEMESRAR